MASYRFLGKRLLLLVPVLFGVATFVFAILHLTPGDPARIMAGRRASPEFVEQIRVEIGLDRPLYVQYVDFLTDVVQFDFGESFKVERGESVFELLQARFPVTLELALLGQLIGILVGIPLGVISAIKQDTLADHASRIGALAGISVPIYWSGPLLILVFAQGMDLFPTYGRIAIEHDVPTFTGMVLVDSLLAADFAAFESAVRHLLLPALSIGIYSLALISRMMRSSMLEVIRQNYMRTARAKGQGARITLMKHGFRNALIPVVTVIGIQFGTLLGGAVLTETVFSINGIGTLLVDAINSSDYPVVQGTVLLFALLFTLVNLGVDLTYSYLDPRIDQ